jgi:hypothetical protein
VLDHHANSDFYSAGSLKQQSVAMGRHVSQLGHIILIRTNKYMLLLHIAVNSNYQVYTNDGYHFIEYSLFSTLVRYNVVSSTPRMSEFELTTLVVIDIDCTSSC